MRGSGWREGDVWYSLIINQIRPLFTPVKFFAYSLKKGYCISAHVLLNLLNEFRKSDKMRGLPSMLSLFRNEFNKFNNTGAGFFILFIM